MNRRKSNQEQNQLQEYSQPVFIDPLSDFGWKKLFSEEQAYSSNLNLKTNQELKACVELYQTYISAKESGEIDYGSFWVEDELHKYKVPDLASHYLLPKENLAIMGVSKIDESRYLFEYDLLKEVYWLEC